MRFGASSRFMPCERSLIVASNSKICFSWRSRRVLASFRWFCRSWVRCCSNCKACSSSQIWLFNAVHWSVLCRVFKVFGFFLGLPNTRLTSLGSSKPFSFLESNFCLILVCIVVRDTPQFRLASEIEIHIFWTVKEC